MSSAQSSRYDVRGKNVLMKEVRGLLDDSGPLLTQEAADELDCDPSTARDAMYALEERGEIERRWDLRKPSRLIWVPTRDLDV